MTKSSETAPSQALRGVFTAPTTATVGFGHTKRRVQQTVYVYAEETADGMMACRALDAEFLPQGDARLVPKEELLGKYVPAPHIFLNKVLPALARLERAVDTADQFREDGQLFSAEFEYKNALRIDENHIRASFGLGLVYLDRGEADNARLVFRKLTRLEGALAPEYKHLFNEFGIKLRKNRMYTQAVGHYAKALRLSPTDDHLLYNLSRAFLEKGRLGMAKRFINKALETRPDFPEAKKLLEAINSKLIDIIPDSDAFSPAEDTHRQEDA